jgi:hypothetical protein
MSLPILNSGHTPKAHAILAKAVDDNPELSTYVYAAKELVALQKAVLDNPNTANSLGHSPKVLLNTFPTMLFALHGKASFALSRAEQALTDSAGTPAESALRVSVKNLKLMLRYSREMLSRMPVS